MALALRFALVFLTPLLTHCGSGDFAYYFGPGSEYVLGLDDSNATFEERTTAGVALEAPTLEGEYEEFTGGFLSIDFAGTPATGLRIPGYGVFLQRPSAPTQMLALVSSPEGCPTSDTNWNWVGWTSPGTSDDVAASFYGVLTWGATALSFPKRFNLPSGSDLGTQSFMLTGTCTNGHIDGHSSNGTSWYARGTEGVVGKRSTTTNDLILALPQTQYFAGDLPGSYSALIVQQGATTKISYARFSATASGANASLTGHPLSVPGLESDDTRTFNISLTAFQVGTDGVSTGSVTVIDPDLTGGTSVPLNIKCIGAKTLGDLERPVLFCVSEGYATGGATKTAGKSFHYILRGE